MSLAAKLKLLRYYRDFLLRRRLPAQPPLRLWVDITSRCNLKCVACPQRQLSDSQRGDMDPALLQAIGRQIAGWHGWGGELNLFHRGEPLLHPDLPYWIRRYRRAGARVRIHSNATLLNPDTVAGLLWAGPELFTCSVDSLEPREYAAARVGANLGRTLAGLELLLSSRGRLGLARPGISLLTMGETPPDPRNTLLARLKRLGLNRVIHRKPHNWGGLTGDGGWKGKPAVCTFPWYGLAVLSDGRVTPCPQDFMGGMVLGDLRAQRLRDIWQGRPARDLRRAHARHDLGSYPVCAACDRIRRPTILGIPLEHARNFVTETLLGN